MQSDSQRHHQLSLASESWIKSPQISNYEGLHQKGYRTEDTPCNGSDQPFTSQTPVESPVFLLAELHAKDVELEANFATFEVLPSVLTQHMTQSAL